MPVCMSAGNDDVEEDGVTVHVIFPDGSSGKLVLKKDGTLQDVYSKVKEKISVDGGVIHIALASCTITMMAGIAVAVPRKYLIQI